VVRASDFDCAIATLRAPTGWASLEWAFWQQVFEVAKKFAAPWEGSWTVRAEIQFRERPGYFDRRGLDRMVPSLRCRRARR
jgi:hypothetical protein